MKKFIIPILLILFVIVLVVSTRPYVAFSKYSSEYENEPTHDNLFELCNVASRCYDFSEFCELSKIYFDKYSSSDIKEYYNIEIDEANRIYDAFLAEFLVKSILYEYIEESELPIYFAKTTGDGYFPKIMWDRIDSYCHNKKSFDKIDHSLDIVLQEALLFRDKMVVYTLKVYIYEKTGDTEALNDTMEKMKIISDDYYKEKKILTKQSEGSEYKTEDGSMSRPKQS